MSRKRVPPEAQIIALFTGLSPESKRMVMFGLNAIVGMESPKPPAPSVEKRSSRKSGAGGSTPNIEVVKESVTSAPKATAGLCGVCGNEEGYQDHFQPSPNYHELEVGKKSKTNAA